MTTAPARAVSNQFFTTLRAAAMATASTVVLVALTPGAKAATCTGDGTDNVCVITLGDVGDTQDGAGNTAAGDTAQFDDVGNTLSFTADQFETDGNIINFENAEVVAGTTVEINSSVTGDAPVSMAWTIDGTLRVFGSIGNAIGDASSVDIGATGIFNVDNSETIGALSGAAGASIVVAASEELSADGTSAGTDFAGVISGAGGFRKVGSGELTLSGINTFDGDLTVSGGTLILSADNTGTGAVIVNGGTLEIGHLGAIDSASSLTIASAGNLTGTVAFDVNGNVTNNGTFQGDANITGDVTNGGVLGGNITVTGDVTNSWRIAPGASPGIVTIVGDYSATGSVAHFNMEVDLDAALAAPVNGTTHDFVDIQGNVTGGVKTFVLLDELDDAADTGLPTTGDGIQLIRVTGTATADDFVQGNALTAGIYQYLLTYVEDYSGTDDGYFLQSALRDEMVVHPALLSASQQMIRHCFRDDQRIPDSPKGATYGRAWAGYHQGATNSGADTGIDMDLDYGCTTGGMDWRMGYGWFGGVSGGFGSANGDLVVPSGTGTLDGDARVIEAYAAFTSSAFFVNLSAGYADMDWTYSNRLNAGVLTTVSGFIASAQAGVALDLDFVAIKLFGAVNYDDTNCGDNCFGFTVAEDTGLIEGKGTVRFDGVTWGGSVRPWASVSYSDVLSDGINTISAGGEIVSADTNSELLSIDAGLQTYLDENFALFADGGYHESLSKDINGYRGGVGLKLYW